MTLGPSLTQEASDKNVGCGDSGLRVYLGVLLDLKYCVYNPGGREGAPTVPVSVHQALLLLLSLG